MQVASESGVCKATFEPPRPTEPEITLTLPLAYVKAIAAVFGAGRKDTATYYVRSNGMHSSAEYLDKLSEERKDWHYDIFDVCDEVLKATKSGF